MQNGEAVRALTDLALAVANARGVLDIATEEVQAKERIATVFRKDFNDATKAFDEAVTRFRMGSPWNTDWHGRQCQGEVAG